MITIFVIEGSVTRKRHKTHAGMKKIMMHCCFVKFIPAWAFTCKQPLICLWKIGFVKTFDVKSDLKTQPFVNHVIFTNHLKSRLFHFGGRLSISLLLRIYSVMKKNNLETRVIFSMDAGNTKEEEKSIFSNFSCIFSEKQNYKNHHGNDQLSV